MDIKKQFKDESGKTIAFQLDDGREVTIEQAISLVENGQLPNYMVSSNLGGRYVKSRPDGDRTNNLNYNTGNRA